jgi:hypothetical protein
VGEHLKGILAASRNPFKNLGTLWRFGRSQLAQRFTTPDIPVGNSGLKREAAELARRVRDFGLAVQKVLAHLRKVALSRPAPAGMDEELRIAEVVLKSQYLQERIADVASDLYASSCTLSRLDALLTHGNHSPAELNRDVIAGRYFLRIANRRILQNLAALWDNDDEMTTRAADAALGVS